MFSWAWNVLVCSCLFLVPLANAEKDQPVIKIGFVLPLSGDWAFLGEGIRDSALLAGEDLSQSDYRFELLFEDNRGELKDSASIAKKLISVSKVDALVSIISGVGLLLNPMAEKAQVVNVSICSNTEVAEGRFNFLNYLTAEQGVSKFVKEISSRYPEGVDLGIFALNEAGFNFIVDQLESSVENTPIKLSSIEKFEPKTADFRSQIVRAFREELDAILILGLSPEIEVIAKQLRELGKEIALVSIEGFGLAEDKSVFEGSWFVDAAVPNAEFRARFAERYGREITAGTGHAYDTVMMIAKVVEQAGDGKSKPAPEQIVKSLYEINGFSGVLGKTEIDADGIVSTEPAIKVIRDGKVEVTDSDKEV